MVSRIERERLEKEDPEKLERLRAARRAVEREKYANDPEYRKRRREIVNLSNERNPERVKERAKAWRKNNRDKLNVSKRKWYASSPTARANEYARVRKWISNNRDKHNQKVAGWRAANPEKYRLLEAKATLASSIGVSQKVITKEMAEAKLAQLRLSALIKEKRAKAIEAGTAGTLGPVHESAVPTGICPEDVS